MQEVYQFLLEILCGRRADVAGQLRMRGPSTTMRFARRAASLAILILGGLATAHGQGIGVTPEASAALRHFLTVDCEVGEEGAALDRFLQYADQLEAELRKLLLDGPDDLTQREVREALEAEWDRREAFLSTNPQLGLNPDDLLAVHAVVREDYLEQGTARFEAVCLERAVIGLVAIGSPTALRTLREQASRVDDDLRYLIQTALERNPPSPEERSRLRVRRAASRRSGP